MFEYVCVGCFVFHSCFSFCLFILLIKELTGQWEVTFSAWESLRVLPILSH